MTETISRRFFLTRHLVSALSLAVTNPLRKLGVRRRHPSIDRDQDWIRPGGPPADDTAALQQLIDAAADGNGVALVPGRRFLVDASRSLRLRSGVHLAMSSGTVLQALPTSQGSYAVLLAEDVASVRITGGRIVGERPRHLGSVGEWGMGILVRGSRDVAIEDVEVQDCWGDGIYLGAALKGQEWQNSKRVRIVRVRCHDNRRQGLSVTGCVGLIVSQCTFSATSGTNPQSGVDLETNEGTSISDAEIDDCQFADNAGEGLVLSGPRISGVRVVHCLMRRNSRNGIRVHNAAHCTFERNLSEENGQAGLMVDFWSSANTFVANTIVGNSRASDFAFDELVVASAAHENAFRGNTIGSSESKARFGVRVESADCRANVFSRNEIRPSGRRRMVSDRGTATRIEP